jgi:glucan phosphoethanolaminetransferase (alkaline phosphatase superfamily)
MLNHLPIFGMIVLFFLMAHAVIFKKEKLVKIYLWFFAVTALVTIPVFLTGDPSSEYLKSVFPGVNNDLIENHETFGYISLIIILVLGVSGLVALRFFKSKEILPAWFKYSFLIVALISVFAISWAGKTGGDIRHSEITAEHTIIK